MWIANCLVIVGVVFEFERGRRHGAILVRLLKGVVIRSWRPARRSLVRLRVSKRGVVQRGFRRAKIRWMTVDADRLIERACLESGVSDLGPDGWREGFDQLLLAMATDLRE